MTDTQDDSPTITPARIAGGDPLLERLTGLKLPSLLMGTVYAVVFFGARALAAGLAGHLFTVGAVIGFFETPAQYTNLISGTAVMAYYIWMPRGIVAVFQGLYDHDVIGAPIPKEEHEEQSFADFLRGVQSSFEKRWWPAAALIASTIATFVLVLPQYLSYTDVVADVADPLSLALTVLWIWIALYCVLLVLLYSLLSIYWFYQLFTGFEIEVRPLHPDRAGGLSPLGNFTLRLSYIISIVGLMLVITPMTRSYAITRTLQFRWTPEILIGLGVYLVAAPVVFFAPLSVANRAMRKAKADLLLQVSRRFDAEYKAIRGALSSDVPKIEEHLKTLKELQELHAATTRFPVWPFNMGNVTRFATSYLSPIALAVLTDWLGRLFTP